MYGSEDVKSIRRKVGTTQRVLARVLAVSPRTVESWEAGRSTPNGSSRRLLELLDRDPKIINKLLA
ncbi:helix-turn-helix domain-containing protein [Lacticaseibacillus pantheris]|nr:helix-turn-helix domain-containing protein [Lacticaseibacillus pantheris]WKF86180.1 helix-turn-helix domain-containing protein [Lacticaseibacillus pantheris]